MMRRIITIFTLIFCSTLGAQVAPDKQKHDFGDLYSGATTYVDFRFKNHTNKTHYLLTIDKPKDVFYIFSGKKMLPDSSITIRMKINDSKKGNFNYLVDVYFSDSNTPQTIGLEGNIKEVDQNFLTDCPDFSSTPTSYSNSFEVTIKVIDSLTGLPLKNALVYLVERGELVGEHKTNSKGFVRKSVPIGYYYITAQKESYLGNYREQYFNFKRTYVEIPLQRPEVNNEELYVEISEDSSHTETTDSHFAEASSEKIEETNEVVIVEDADTAATEVHHEIVDPTPLEELPDTLFDDLHFKYNNITFILDVSSSMNSHGKFDLLKLSMIELIKILRPEDAVSMLKYSAEVTTIMSHTKGDHTNEIIETIKGLRTSGLTAGGDAIKAAYRLSKKGYLPNDNNIVIMITDGLFNRGDKNYLKTVSSNYKQKGIRFSVVGIKTADYVTRHMTEVVEKGGGAFIEIRSVDDAKRKIIEEIRRTSFKS
ncbi:VWA domain-containing protein [Crocinitomix catalasitica]|nr:VWA domain-containing protein [Crocinitomix catalasitica]